MNKFLSGCGILFILIILILSLITNIILTASLIGKSSKKEIETLSTFEEELIAGTPTNTKHTIAVIDLTGIISSDIPGELEPTMLEDLTAQLRQAREDEDIKAIILRINSPGGEVTASDILYHHVKKTQAVKPVLTYFDTVAASGGYYAALGATHIMANELTVTGSIGVILQSFTIKDLFEKIGIRALTIKSGKMKDLLNPFRDPVPEEEIFLQEMINETYEKFLHLFTTERKLDPQIARLLADGRIYSGKQALENKLVDSIGYFEDAISQAESLAKIEKARVIRYVAPYNFRRFIRSLSQATIHTLQHGLTLRLPLADTTFTPRPGAFYYLAPHTIAR
jgi:protease-4